MTVEPPSLASCDREPIHLIGAVQPHGALIALAAETFVVEYASTNTNAFLGSEPSAILGKVIDDIIGKDNAEQLRSLSLDPLTPDLLKPWFFNFARPDGVLIDVECLPHRNQSNVILEFFRLETETRIGDDEFLRRGFISKLITAQELHEVANASAQIIREVTRFDRVMIYKFAEDKHGEVIAESTNRSDSFMGLHYPASDIPDPARRHFLLNLTRLIPDINGERIPIVNRSGAFADAMSVRPLDLTFSKLRAVAPVHIEYLNNMGVAATFSISLIANNQLWGLIACHHYTPQPVASSRMRFAELVGAAASSLLQRIENTDKLRKSIAAENAAFRMEQQARRGTPVVKLVQDWAPVLMQLVDAQGLALAFSSNLVCIGNTPTARFDFTELRNLLVDGIATTSQLPNLMGVENEQLGGAAGAALLDLSGDGREYLVFLRDEFDQTIHWAGKPEKLETKLDGGTTRLSPRGSFKLWQEERRGQSKPFDDRDRDALRILRRALFALNSLEHERTAREAQRSSEAEEALLRHALLDASRTSSMGELASAIVHELNQPLFAISNFVNACRTELANAGMELPEHVAQLMDEAVAETARAGDLLHRVRDFISTGDLSIETVDFKTVIRQSIDLALVSSGHRDLQVSILIATNLPRILADPVQIGQVVLNLVRNSINAMREADRCKLTVEVIKKESVVQVFVRDTGHGISPEQRRHLFEPFHASTTKGMGIGLSLCRSIIEAHGGRIWAEPSSNGATVVFQLPIRDVRDG